MELVNADETEGVFVLGVVFKALVSKSLLLGGLLLVVQVLALFGGLDTLFFFTFSAVKPMILGKK